MRKRISILMVLLLFCTGCSSSETENSQEDVNEPPVVEVTDFTEHGKFSDPTPEPEPPAGAEIEDGEPLPLDGRLICIDPGHCVTPLTGKGYTDLVSPLSTETKPLYTAGTTGKNMTEEQLNLTVGLKLRDYLEELGAEVIMTREVSEITITGQERCRIPNKAGADVCIRIHADGSTSTSANGVSVLTPAGDLLGTPSIVDDSTRLGQLMVEAVSKETGAKNRGIMPRSDMTGFNFSEVPTVLIEMGFMTNPEEDALLETDEYQDKIVVGIANSLLQWYPRQHPWNQNAQLHFY